MTHQDNGQLQRVEAMLAAVVALIDTVVAHRHTWKATPPEIRFLSAVASVVREPYPGLRVKDVLTFLMMAKFRLDSTATLLRGNDQAGQ